MRDINPPKRTFPRRLGIGLGVLALILSLGLISVPDRVSAEAPDRDTGWSAHHQRPNWHGGPTAIYPPGSSYYYYRHPAVSCGGNTVAGVVIGAGVGGLIGSQIGDRPGDAGTTVLGALVGAVLGGVLGQSTDRANGC